MAVGNANAHAPASIKFFLLLFVHKKKSSRSPAPARFHRSSELRRDSISGNPALDK
jgi:hypothetical protein